MAVKGLLEDVLLLVGRRSCIGCWSVLLGLTDVRGGWFLLGRLLGKVTAPMSQVLPRTHKGHFQRNSVVDREHVTATGHFGNTILAWMIPRYCYIFMMSTGIYLHLIHVVEQCDEQQPTLWEVIFDGLAQESQGVLGGRVVDG